MTRKLVFYTHAFAGGGAETVFSRLAAAFVQAGDTAILCADVVGQGYRDPEDGVRRIVLGRNHAAAARRLAALLHRDKPDASFSALGAQNLKHLAAAMMAGRAHRCVLGYHGFALAEPKRLSQASFQAAAVTTRLAARTICVSDTLLADIRTRWHASPTRTMRIYNPIASGPHETARPVSPPLVVACGRLVPVKRFNDLVRAVAQVAPPETQLAILGEGPERGTIEAAVERHGLARRVHLPGHVADPSMWYRRASCLAITSESESFGLTAAEALAHGVPVVSTDCGGPSEILEHGRYGRIVPVGDIAALAEALTATLRDFGDAGERQERAQAFSLESARVAYAAVADALA